MGSWSITHWIIVLIVVALVFGTKKLRNMGEDLGAAIKGFKDGMKQGQEEGNTKKEDETSVETKKIESTQKSTISEKSEIIADESSDKK